MPPHPSDDFASDRAPRHAAEADSDGRHRRPESLADSEHLRPAPVLHRSSEPGLAGPPISRRSRSRQAAAADADILEARRAAARMPFARPGPIATSRTGSRRHASTPHRRRATSQRGRHATPVDPLAITVRPLNEGLRAAGAWALDTGDRPPATGSHRAPGTLPIESWLLIGKTRQQALLASLVAVGLALILIPAQRDNDADPVNASDHASVSTEQGGSAREKAPESTSKPPRKTTPAAPGKPPGESTEKPGTPPATAAPAAPAEDTDTPVIAVPPGDGPAKSLTTTGTAAVALTFDDGPDPVQTPKILAMLDKYRIRATFCLVGKQVQRHPEIVRQIVAAGHTLCNHTWDHSLTIGRHPATLIRADLERTNAAIRAAVPDAEIPFFRAPGGNFTDRLVQLAYADRMASLYWEVDPRDWDHTKEPDDLSHVDRVVEYMQRTIQPGSIVLSHDFNQPDTILAYEKLLPWISENFTFGRPEVPPIEPPAATPASTDASAPPA